MAPFCENFGRPQRHAARAMHAASPALTVPQAPPSQDISYTSVPLNSILFLHPHTAPVFTRAAWPSACFSATLQPLLFVLFPVYLCH